MEKNIVNSVTDQIRVLQEHEVIASKAGLHYAVIFGQLDDKSEVFWYDIWSQDKNILMWMLDQLEASYDDIEDAGYESYVGTHIRNIGSNGLAFGN
jgi:hypothetical protein|nr:MAG TPA: hypothetical protein [Caudoviricetes sp.]